MTESGRISHRILPLIGTLVYAVMAFTKCAALVHFIYYVNIYPDDMYGLVEFLIHLFLFVPIFVLGIILYFTQVRRPPHSQWVTRIFLVLSMSEILVYFAMAIFLQFGLFYFFALLYDGIQPVTAVLLFIDFFRGRRQPGKAGLAVQHE